MNLTKHSVYNDFFKPLRFASSWLLKKSKGTDHGFSKNMCLTSF